MPRRAALAGAPAVAPNRGCGSVRNTGFPSRLSRAITTRRRRDGANRGEPSAAGASAPNAARINVLFSAPDALRGSGHAEHAGRAAVRRGGIDGIAPDNYSYRELLEGTAVGIRTGRCGGAWQRSDVMGAVPGDREGVASETWRLVRPGRPPPGTARCGSAAAVVSPWLSVPRARAERAPDRLCRAGRPTLPRHARRLLAALGRIPGLCRGGPKPEDGVTG